MEQRNLDLDLPMTAEQWDVLVRTADELGPAEGFRSTDGDPPEIDVLATPERAPAGWREWVSDREAYGDPERPAARLEFNGGSPYARIEPWADPDEPAILQPRVEALRQELERWVRGRWHELLERSGIDYVRGHVPTS